MTIWELVFMLTGFVAGAIVMASWALYRDTKRCVHRVQWEHKIESSLQHGVKGVLEMGKDGWEVCGVASGSSFILKRRVTGRKE